jgi:enoyl-CoA hydratase
MTDSGYETILVERHGKVGWIINNRPEKLNSMNVAQREDLARAWQELQKDSGVHVIVHTGTGRAFHTGTDVSEVDGAGMEQYRQEMLDFHLKFSPLHQNVTKPVITAVNGLCVGGGLHFVADADIVIAATDAQFGDPHVSVGQVSAIETIGLARRIPFEAVMRMALVGRHERMSAQRAYELGMVSQLVEPDNLREEAQALAEKIARNSPAALAATKAALWGALDNGLTEACRVGAKRLVELWGHPDQAEGPRAFVEKREAKWLDPE